MSATTYKILLRKKEYDVYVEDSGVNDTIMWFKYDNTRLLCDVYLPDNLEFQEINEVLTEMVRISIRQYNRKRYEKSERFKNAKKRNKNY